MTPTMLRDGYHGLLVDFGGVLTTNFFAPFEAFCERHGLSPTTIRELMTNDPDGRELWQQVERGQITQSAFQTRLAAMLGVRSDGLVRELLADLRPDHRMLDAVQAARRGGVRAAVVTNSWGTEPYDPYEPWQLNTAFDAVLVSHQVGLRKPDPAIYRLAAKEIGVAPGACVFVDDVASNLPAARSLGMAVIHHVATDDTIRALEHLLRLPLGSGVRRG